MLTPVFKNKGLATDAKNYRGITILPTITEIVETLLLDRIQSVIDAQQNKIQRGFTRNPPPHESLVYPRRNYSGVKRSLEASVYCF